MGPDTVLAAEQYRGVSKIEQEISEVPALRILFYTLTHPIPGFTETSPAFSSQKALLDNLISESKKRAKNDSSRVWSILTRLAHEKIENEWNRWTRVHDDFHLDPWTLDNRSMIVLHRFIIIRDRMRCVLCGADEDLTIHHIFPKCRGAILPPRYGRSVPANLVTLCRNCHGQFDPAILNPN